MFFNINNYFDAAEMEQEFNLDHEIDSLVLVLKLRTLVVPLGQRFPIKLQNFLDKEEKYRVKLKSIFIYRHKKHGWNEAKNWLKNFFSHRWQLINQL